MKRGEKSKPVAVPAPTGVCEAFAAPTSVSRCGKPAKGILTSLNPKSKDAKRRTVNWPVCSTACAESLRDDLAGIGIPTEEISV